MIHLKNPRLLVVSANRWPAAGQISSALLIAGFEVAVVCPISSPVYQLRKLHARFPYRSWNSSASIKSAIAAWLPDILVATDDLAAHALRCLYYEASQHLSHQSVALMDCIELSFGDRRSSVIAQSKNEVLSLAVSLGINCPQTIVLADHLEFAQKEREFVFPVMVKTDDAWGGLGVRFVKNRLALQAAVAELSLPYNWPGRLKRLLGQFFPRRLLHWLFGWPQKMSIQRHVVGFPCTRAVVCWKGKILAGITVDALATAHEFGPATVVKIANRLDVTAAAEKIVAKLGLSGFIGFDFVVDSANNAWFLEMNARATPTCHICAENQDLAGSFFLQISGMRPKGIYCNIQRDTFTLFPCDTRGARHTMPDLPSEQDAPADEPEFVAACRSNEETKMQNWFCYTRVSTLIGNCGGRD